MFYDRNFTIENNSKDRYIDHMYPLYLRAPQIIKNSVIELKRTAYIMK